EAAIASIEAPSYPRVANAAVAAFSKAARVLARRSSWRILILPPGRKIERPPGRAVFFLPPPWERCFEGLDNLWVELRSRAAQYLSQRGVWRLAFTVWTVGDNRVVRIADGEDARAERNV